MDPIVIGIIGVLALIIMVFIGTPVGAALGLTGVVGYAIVMSVDGAFTLLGILPYGGLAVFSYATIPLFIAMGTFIMLGNIGEDVYKMCQAWFGKLPGGVIMASIAANAGFGAVSGSSIAASAIFSKIAIPEMVRLGVQKKLAAGSVAAAGTIAVMIPPSITAVLYGIITGVPIGKVLLAGFLPGILSTVMFMGMIYFRVLKNPELAPKISTITWKERFSSLKGAWGIVVLFILVLGGIYSGLVTPTEAGALGALGALLILIASRKFTLRNFKESLMDAVTLTSQIFFIILGGLLFTRFVGVSGIGKTLVGVVGALDVNRYVILVGILLVYIFLGCLLDGASMLIITLPIVFPLISALGFDGVWFGIIAIKVVEIGMITPPLGLNVYVVQSTSPVPVSMEELFRGIGPFLVTELITLTLLIAFPQITLFIPNLMK